MVEHDETLKILLVDDDASTRLMVCDSLDNINCEIDEATTGQKALQCFEQQDYDAILLDVNLPEVNGLDVCLKIRDSEKGKNTPVVMITGCEDIESITKAYSVGATDFLCKPLNWDLLPYRIAYIIKASKALAGSEVSSKQLVKTQEQLLQLEKLASIEQLAADVASDKEINKFLTKPRDKNEVKQKIRTALEQHNINKTEKTPFVEHNNDLTNLPGRSFICKHLDLTIQQNQKKMIGVIVLSIDKFKHVNQSLGVAKGDKIIQLLTERLKNHFADNSLVSRIDGDTFCVVINHIVNNQALEVMALELHQLFTKPFVCDDASVYFTVSSGLSAYPTHGTTSIELLHNAEQAMFFSKNNGRNQSAMYSSVETIQQKSYQDLLLESELHEAVAKQELTLHYQPQIEIKNEKLIGFETLLRWVHPKLGYVSPSVFIPILEETGLIHTIGDWIIDSALRQLKYWNSLNYKAIKISINVTPQQLLRTNFVDFLKQKIEMFELNANNITLEITENNLMDNKDKNIARFNELVDLGVNIALDDFGTGYSALSYIRDFPISVFKIDKAFIDEVGAAHSNSALVKSMIDMAKSLGQYVVAEGVETIEQLHTLREFKCDCIQGFYFSKPLEASDCLNFINLHNMD